MKTKILKNDMVKVIAGKDKGKIAKVTKVLTNQNTAIVEGVNMAKKHIKSKSTNNAGEIIEVSQPINLSNLMVYEAKTKKANRVGYKTVNNEKVRIYKKSSNQITK